MQNIEQALHRIEVQARNVELQVQFKKNMDLFKKHVPRIYAEFSNYTPEELRISYDKEGFLNLVNINLNNKPVYAEDPKEFCKKQLDVFRKKPLVSVINFSKNTSGIDFYHAKSTNKLLDVFEKQPSPHTDAPIGFLMMTGCGLGYQIQMAIDTLDVRNMMLFDPHKDSFYACLHTLDWQPILSHFANSDRTLKLCIGMSEIEVLTDIRLWVDEIGLHNFVTTFIYRHFNSTKENEFIERYKKEFHLSGTGLGFFEDEQISLAHTAENLNSEIPILSIDKKKIKSNLPPAFVIGNGPSLDELIDFIKSNNKEAIIFSAGSTTGTLFKHGITPDFHIEMERTQETVDWIENGTTAEYRENITIFGLSTVSPDAFNLFDKKLMAKKANDLGQHIIEGSVNTETYLLPLCNPTVTNMALSSALALGFNNVLLMGVDLGMVDKSKHHAESSIYSEITDKAKETIDKNLESYTYKVKGNFRPEVETTSVLDTSRVNMEILIQRTPHVNVYNLNDGAMINGAIPAKTTDIKIPASQIDKKIIVEKISEDFFIKSSNPNIDKKLISNKYLTDFYNIEKKLKLRSIPSSPTKIYDSINDIYKIVSNLEFKAPVTRALLKGSLNSYFSIIIKNCLYEKSTKERTKKFKESINIYHDFIDYSYKTLKKDPLKLDANRSLDFNE